MLMAIACLIIASSDCHQAKSDVYLSSTTCCNSESEPDLRNPGARVGLTPILSIWDNKDAAAAAKKKQSLYITQLDPLASNIGILVKNSSTLPFAEDIVNSVETVDGFANVNLLRLMASVMSGSEWV